MKPDSLVSVIIIFYNSEKFITEAIESVLSQTYQNWELILVDDGSTDKSTEIALIYSKKYPDKVNYLEHENHVNKGMSASRNLGIRKSIGEYISFLDSDDVWFPFKVEQQIEISHKFPEVSMIYGSSIYWYSWSGMKEDKLKDFIPKKTVKLDSIYKPPTLLKLLYPLGKATSACPSDIFLKKDIVEQVGGFEESFKGAYEDIVFLSKIYLNADVYISENNWIRYRIHDESCMSKVKEFCDHNYYMINYLKWLRTYMIKSSFKDYEIWDLLENKLIETELNKYKKTNDLKDLQVTDENYDEKINKLRTKIKKLENRVTSLNENKDSWKIKAEERKKIGEEKNKIIKTLKSQSLNKYILILFLYIESFYMKLIKLFDRIRNIFRVIYKTVSKYFHLTNFKSFDATNEETLIEKKKDSPFSKTKLLSPVSKKWGFDRGCPVDRYYIEKFLEKHSDDINGHVLEINDNRYTLKYGKDKVKISDILDIDKDNKKATIIDDLTTARCIKSETYNCIIVIQTLQLIYDLEQCVRTMYRILKPGGVVLATFPGITKIDTKLNWYWNLTNKSSRVLFEQVFDKSNLSIEIFGNVLSASAFLYGLSSEELTDKELDYSDPEYEVTIAVKAIKK